MEDEVYEKYNKYDYDQKHLQDKYDLLGIPIEKILEKTKLANDDDLNKGILYGQLVGFKPIGEDIEENSKVIKYLVNMDQGDESSLAIIYGVALENQVKMKKTVNLIETKNNKKYPLTYLVREWVAGHGFSSGEDLFEKDLHDRLVLLYRLISQIQYIHGRQIPYIFLRPNKIIVTIDMDIKLLDFVRVDDYVLKKIKKDISRKNGKVSNQHRFLYPEIFDENYELLKAPDRKYLVGDRFEDEKLCKVGDEIKNIITWLNKKQKRLEELKKSENTSNYEITKKIIKLEEKIEQKRLDHEWLIKVESKRKSNSNLVDPIDLDEKDRIKNEETYEKEYSGNEKKEYDIFHREFVRFRKYDLWSIGCLIYYALKEEFPWVDFKRYDPDEKKEIETTFKNSNEIYNFFKEEMKKEPKDRYFFINKEDIEKDKNDERNKVFDIARRCLSGEIKDVKEILSGNNAVVEYKNDSSELKNKEIISQIEVKNCFGSLKLLRNFLQKGEVHYDFNAGK